MDSALLDYVVSTFLLGLAALICVFISRPILQKRWSRIASQTLSVLLMIVAYIFSKGMAESKSSPDENISFFLIFIILTFLFKFVAMYLIACYAKSVLKSPYWSFVGILNILIALPLLIFGLWNSGKRKKLTRDEMVNELKRLVDDPNSSQDIREEALARLRIFNKSKV